MRGEPTFSLQVFGTYWVDWAFHVKRLELRLKPRGALRGHWFSDCEGA